MMEEVIPSIWASMNSWFTPTVLFVLLNLVIGTIAVTTSKSTTRRSHHREENAAVEPTDPSRKLSRSPSAVLERLKSFDLYRRSSTVIQTAPPPPIEAVHACPDPSVHVAPAPGGDHHYVRSQSDTHPTAGEVPKKLAGKMKKSASLKSAFSHFEEGDIVRRPATAREGEEEGEVDARASDFINRFRQELKLQRVDSIIRYKEMLNRGN